MLRPWMISVLSTNYDLEECRGIVIDNLINKGYAVSAYELAEQPVIPKIHSHDSCLFVLDRVDIAILIINKRSGGMYVGHDETKKTYSITEAEYRQALENNVPVFTFVHQDAYDELHKYKKAFGEYLKSKGIVTRNKKKIEEQQKLFDTTFACNYVQDVKTLHFIDHIQHICETDQKASNWMSFYTNIVQLWAEIEGKLQGYSCLLLNQLADKQEEILLNRHTSVAFGMSLRDVFSSSLFVEPSYEVVNGSNIISTTSTLCDSLCTSLMSRYSVMILGEAGHGKTTIIAKCFKDLRARLCREHPYTIPLFVQLRDKDKNYDFDIEKIINDEIKEKFERVAYPHLDIKDLSFVFFCDGMDELTESLSEDELNRIMSASLFSQTLVLTSRCRFATRYLGSYRFNDIFALRIKLKKWNNEYALQYVGNLYKGNEIIKNNHDKIEELLKRKNEDFIQFFDTPLLISMFFLYIEYLLRNGDDLGSISIVKLFGWWIGELARREQEKVDGITDSALIVKIWEKTAWCLYEARIINEKLHKDDLTRTLLTEYPESLTISVMKTFDSLFDMKGDIISGTFHEQFMEYCIADYLINACLKEQPPFPNFLKIVMRPEINRYFRGLWTEMSSGDKKKVYDVISNVYFRHINEDTPEAIALRVHAIYHMCRLDFKPDTDRNIDKAFKLEDNIAVKLSLFFGAVKRGQMDREDEFYQFLQTDIGASKANRGYHLTYYGDIPQKEVLPYVDDESSSWENTLKAIVSHFKSDDLGHYYLRRIELLTMQELMKARGNVGPLTDETINHFSELLSSSRYASDPSLSVYNKYLISAFDSFRTTYNELPKIKDVICELPR